MKEKRLKVTPVGSPQEEPTKTTCLKVKSYSHRRVEELAGEPGFEPSLPGPEPDVLPLDYPPVTDGEMCISPIVQLESRPLPGLLNGILPVSGIRELTF